LAEGDFPSKTKQRLRELLGSRFDAAFPWLELAATLYKLATAIKVSA